MVIIRRPYLLKIWHGANSSLLSKGHCSGRGFKDQVWFQVQDLPPGLCLICQTVTSSGFPSWLALSGCVWVWNGAGMQLSQYGRKHSSWKASCSIGARLLCCPGPSLFFGVIRRLQEKRRADISGGSAQNPREGDERHTQMSQLNT